MQVGYLGPKGTFSEEAASKCFPGTEFERIDYPTFLDILEAVDAQRIRFGVVPIENSIEGTINVVLDGLQHYPHLFIQREFVLTVEEHLLVLPSVQLDEIHEIWSHPQPLAQCRQFIRSLNVTTKNFDSTASAAVELVKSGRRDVGVIGPSWAGERLQLSRLAENIHDYPDNHTRFFVVGYGPDEAAVLNSQVDGRPRKSLLLIIPTQEHVGILVNILNVFAALEMNLTWIESRPTKRRLGEYQFFMELETSPVDIKLQKSLQILQTYGHTVRVLGSY